MYTTPELKLTNYWEKYFGAKICLSLIDRERRTDLPACEEAKTAGAIDPAVNECLRNGLNLLSEQLTKLSRYTTDGRSQNILKQAFTEVCTCLVNPKIF